jgi:hypothetical protein
VLTGAIFFFKHLVEFTIGAWILKAAVVVWFFFGNTGVWTQGLTLARQVLYT